MKRKIFKAQLVSLFLVIGFNCESLIAQDKYFISVDDAASREVSIQATLYPNNDTLIMSPFGAEHLPDGWATFVSDLIAKDRSGQPIHLKSEGNGVFVLEEFHKGYPVFLNYTVRILHDKQYWPFGYKEAAYVNDEMIVATGNSLFITRLDLENATIEFQLKDSYKVATPWKPIASSVYVANGAEDLVWNVIAIGDFHLSKLQTGKTNISLAYNGSLASKSIIDSTIKEVINQYVEIYGGAPAISSEGYLFVMNVDPAYVGGGAAFVNSLSILFASQPDVPEVAETTSWHHILTHEIGHLWKFNTNDQTAYFNEGFIDYLAYVVQFNLGFFDEQQWTELKGRKRQELKQATGVNAVSLENAGKDKSGNYDIIYSGGFLLANELNENLKRSTNNKRDIKDFFRRLYRETSLKYTPVTTAVIREVAEEVCRCSLETIFAENFTITK